MVNNGIKVINKIIILVRNKHRNKKISHYSITLYAFNFCSLRLLFFSHFPPKSDCSIKSHTYTFPSFIASYLPVLRIGKLLGGSRLFLLYKRKVLRSLKSYAHIAVLQHFAVAHALTLRWLMRTGKGLISFAKTYVQILG